MNFKIKSITSGNCANLIINIIFNLIIYYYILIRHLQLLIAYDIVKIDLEFIVINNWFKKLSFQLINLFKLSDDVKYLIEYNIHFMVIIHRYIITFSIFKLINI